MPLNRSTTLHFYFISQSACVVVSIFAIQSTHFDFPFYSKNDSSMTDQNTTPFLLFIVQEHIPEHSVIKKFGVIIGFCLGLLLSTSAGRYLFTGVGTDFHVPRETPEISLFLLCMAPRYLGAWGLGSESGMPIWQD